MVYTGKPSRACQTCKNRRIKCDEQRPICGQCKKSKRDCPGYPDEFDLVFRDENKAMRQRNAKKTTGLRRGSSQLSQHSSSTEVSPRSSLDTTPGTGVWSIEDPTTIIPRSSFEAPPVTAPYDTRLLPPWPTFEVPSNPQPPNIIEDSTGMLPPWPSFEDPSAPQSQDHEDIPTSLPPSNSTQDLQVAIIPPHTTPTPQDTFSSIMWNLENSMPPTLAIAPEFEAVGFFFKNFLSLPQQAESMRGFLELLVPMYNQARPSSAMHLAVNAVALACIGKYPGREDQLSDALKAYGKALRKVKKDLEDPVLARSDETVLAVLLFSLYETILSTDASIKAWGNHVDGAVTLTKLRGTDQFKNPMSHAVFRAVRTMMITSCVQRSKPISDFPSQSGWLGTDMSEENAANRLTLICIDLPNIRARANTLTSRPYSASLDHEAHSIITLAEMVDSNLEQWYLTLPSEWQYHTVGIVSEMPTAATVAEAESWFGPQHAYHDVPLASIVNDYRVCRIFCQRVILACITWLDFPEPQTAYNKAIFVIQQMVDEIAACVPFHLTYDMQPVAKELGQEQNAVEAFGGYSLVWPLYVAANTETVPKLQRDWLSGRLYAIGERFGLSSAQILVLARRHVLNCGPMFP